MTAKTAVRSAAGCFAGGAALAALGYAAYAGAAWTRYGHATRTRRPEEEDGILDRFMPLYDVVERHHVRVAAPAPVALAAAREMDLLESRVVRAIFKGRELMLGATPDDPGDGEPRGLLEAALAIGWGVLADQSGREVVLGAITKPWEPDPVFRDLLPGEFAAFGDPGYVKIVWTLRADPVDDRECIFRTETRAMATDIDARMKFRRYWALVSPGVELIRRAMLVSLKREAERRMAPPIPLVMSAS
jgi:hypothetical protein